MKFLAVILGLFVVIALCSTATASWVAEPQPGTCGFKCQMEQGQAAKAAGCHGMLMTNLPGYRDCLAPLFKTLGECYKKCGLTEKDFAPWRRT